MTAAFAGLDVELRNATESLLPIFQSQLNATAGTLNGVGRSLLRDLAGPLRSDVAGALTLNNDLLERAAPIANDVTSRGARALQRVRPTR